MTRALRPGLRELAVESVTLWFGRGIALDDVLFTVQPGSLHALVGPSGAGKTCCADVISGLRRPTFGAVRLGDELITSVAAYRRAALGIGRSFQQVALSPGSSVLDNVLLGRYVLTGGGFLAAGLRLTRRSERRHAARAAEICDVLGIADRLHDRVAGLPHHVRKRVDLARALAIEPTLLLLDAPTAGLTGARAAQLVATIAQLRVALGVTVLLIEQDPILVTGVADRVTVLEAGTVLADGPPEQVLADPAVIRAYRGGDPGDPGEPAEPADAVGAGP